MTQPTENVPQSRGQKRTAVSALLLALLLAPGAARAEPGENPGENIPRIIPGRWVCTEAPAGTPEGAACTEGAVTLQPCRAAVVTPAAAAALEEDRADERQRARDAEGALATERAQRAQDRAACERVTTILRRERDDARDGRAACEAEAARCREQLAESVSPGLPWWGTLLVGVGAVGLGVVVGVSL